ncbi:MAG: hypothetical protein KAI22_09645 [Gammaproteobacteria bacterium]|nr:hypothetical protein [Gammaproteobacteria bacterium]
MLYDSLSEMTVPELKSRLNLIKSARKVTLKAEIIDEISRLVLSDTLEVYWQKLTNLEKMAVAESVYHWQGRFYYDRFSAKYSDVIPDSMQHTYSRNKTSAGSGYLGLFLFQGFIPIDLQTNLKNFVPIPPENKITITKTEIPDKHYLGDKNNPDFSRPITKLLTEPLIRHDLPAVLNLINLGKISVSEKTGVATGASIRILESALLGGDYYQTDEQLTINNYQGGAIRPIRPYAWPLLLQSSSLVRRNGKKLALTRKGIKAITTPYADSIREIYERWRDKGSLDEYSRINLVKGQKAKGRIMTAKELRRSEMELILSDCPEGKWINIDKLFSFVRATAYDLSVCHDSFRLYLEEQGYGTLGYAENPFEVLEGRYIMVYLFEYLATLGMVDIAYVTPYYARKDYQDLWGASELHFLSRYDGLLYFRLNALGSYCLGLSAHYQPTQTEKNSLLDINDQLEITLTRQAEADEAQILSLFTRNLSDKPTTSTDDTCSLILSETRTLDALENGQNTKDFYHFLEQSSATALPEEVEEFFEQMRFHATALCDGGKAQIIHSSSRLIKLLVNDSTTQKLCQQIDAKSIIVTAKKEKEFRKAVRKLGYIFPQTARA